MFNKGDKVKNKTYGIGIVLKYDSLNRWYDVKFENKVISISENELEKVIDIIINDEETIKRIEETLKLTELCQRTTNAPPISANYFLI